MNSSFDSMVQSDTTNKSATCESLNTSNNSSNNAEVQSPKPLSTTGSKLNSLINTLTSAKNETKLNADKATNGSAISAAETLLEIKNFFSNKSVSSANECDAENAKSTFNEENSFDDYVYDEKEGSVISPASRETDEEEQKILAELQNDNGNF